MTLKTFLIHTALIQGQCTIVCGAVGQSTGETANVYASKVRTAIHLYLEAASHKLVNGHSDLYVSTLSHNVRGSEGLLQEQDLHVLGPGGGQVGPPACDGIIDLVGARVIRHEVGVPVRPLCQCLDVTLGGRPEGNSENSNAGCRYFVNDACPWCTLDEIVNYNLTRLRSRYRSISA